MPKTSFQFHVFHLLVPGTSTKEHCCTWKREVLYQFILYMPFMTGEVNVKTIRCSQRHQLWQQRDAANAAICFLNRRSACA
jgi:hypothetical protein